MTDLVVVEEIQILAQQPDDSVLVDEVEIVQVVAVAEQGPRGPQGIPGPAGGTTFVRQSAGPLSALRVLWEDHAGVVALLDYRDGAHIDAISGLSLTATPNAAPLNVQRSGPVDDGAWNWMAGRVYLGTAGTLTQTPPADGYDVLVGYAVSPTRLYLDIQDPIQLEN